MDELIEFMFYLEEQERNAKANKSFFNEKSKNYKHWFEWEYSYGKMQSILCAYMNRRKEFLEIYGANK